MPSWLLATLTALSTSVASVVSSALASDGVFCGAAGEKAASVSASQQWLQPQADALTTHCNGVCPGLCVYRASATNQCSADALDVSASTSNYLSPQCVRGESCAYECVASTTTSRAPLRWTILQARDGLATINTATTTTTASGLTTHNTTRLTSAIRRLARLELPGNVVELSVVGDNTLLLDADATALASYQSLVKLELVSVDVPDVWTRLPRMANLQSLSLVDASLVQWPLEDAGAAVPAIQTLDLHLNPGLQLSTGAFSASLRHIDLSFCGLSDLPADLASVANLRSLTLDGNPLSAVSSVDSALPSALEYLSLRNCSLPSAPDGLAVLSRLLSLDLAYNPRVGASLDVLALPLTSLLTLDLSHCNLASFAFDVLASSPLRTLRLAANKLPSASLQTFTTTGALTELDLSATNLNAVPTAIASSATLRVLNLAGNSLASLAAWPAPSTLTSLNVSSSGLTSLPDAPLATLETLDASFNALSSLPQSLADSQRLRVLNVTGNAALRVASLPPSLVELFAANISLSSLPALNWTALRTVDLSFNSLPQFTIEERASTSADGFSFRDLSASSASVPVPGQLRLNLRHNKLSQFPSALLSLSAELSELDLRGNPFSPLLRLTTDQFTLLKGLTRLQLDKSSLDMTCEAAKLQKLAIVGGSVSVCVDNEPLTPGTVAPGGSTDRAGNATGSNSGGGGTAVKRTAASDASNRAAMIATASVGGFVLALILVGLIFVYRRASKPGAADTRGGGGGGGGGGGRGDAHANRTQFALTSISLPTRESHEHQSLPKSRALSNAPQPTKHQSQAATTSLDSEQSEGLDLDLDLGDSIVATLDVEAAALLEDISDDLDFISWRIRPRHVTLGSHVATGTSCFVYRATLVRFEAVAASSRRGGGGAPPPHHQHALPTILDVAVKKLPPHQTRTDVDAIERLSREVRVLAPFQHPKIAAFLGVSWTQRLDLQIVLEWMPDGDLRTLLNHQATAKKRRRASVSDRWLPHSLSFSFGSSAASPASSPLSSSSVLAGGRALRIAMDVAEALAYVHAQNKHLLHQRRHWRLTSHKVLLDASMDVAKLCDFGSSAKDREAFAHLRRWIAPEVLAGDAPSVSHADVYALGLLLAELDTFELPFQRVLRQKSLGDGRDDPLLASERALLRGIIRGDVEDMGPLLLSASCPPEIGDLVRWCTQREPGDRPSAAQVLRMLRSYAVSAGGREEDERRTRGVEEPQEEGRGVSFYDGHSSGYSVRPSSAVASSVDKRRSSGLWI